jgi:hypothetical protein
MHSPALPEGHPFTHVREGYWSSTTSMFESDWAWALYLTKGAVGVGQKRGAHFSVWAVRDASGIREEGESVIKVVAVVEEVPDIKNVFDSHK